MNRIRKALVGTVLAFGGTLGAALLDGNISGQEALAALGASLVVGFGVYKVRNDPA